MKSGGWIKFDKEVIDDPRLEQAAMVLATANPLRVSNALCFYLNALRGALVTMWVYADTHIRNDDTLPISSQTLNAIVGIEGFCALIGPQWITELDGGNIKLPGYCEKNGVIARKKRALDAKARQAAYRVRHNAQHNDSVTRDDPVTKCVETETELETESKKRKIPKENHVPVTTDTVPGLDMAAWNDWLAYRKEIGKRLRPVSQLGAAKEMSRLGAGQRAAVEHSKANGYQGLIAPKPANGAKPGFSPPDHSAEWAEAKHLAASIGYRPPWPQESVGSYLTSVKLAMNRGPARSMSQLAAEARNRVTGVTDEKG
jgi:hypothetical protein